LFHHRLETNNALLDVCGSEIGLIIAAIAGEEFENGPMSDTNCSIGSFVSIEQRAEIIHQCFNEKRFHPWAEGRLTDFDPKAEGPSVDFT